MIGIYKITSPKNRVYIGQSIDIERRFASYKNINQNKSHKRLRLSFLKYGIENHIFEVVEECLESELNTKERYWQDHYNVLSKKGLNCILTMSSNLSGKMSEETKSKISKSHLGKKKSEEHRKNIGLSAKGRKLSEEHKLVLSNSNKGKVISEEHKEALRITRKNELVSNIGKKGKESHMARKVVDTTTGEYWDTLTECCLVNELSIKNMSRKLNGTRRNDTIYIYF